MMTLSSPPQSHDPSHRISCSLNRRRGGLPLLGDLLRMRGDHLGLLAECAATGADIVEVDLASRSAFVLCNPSVAREVLIEDNDAFVRAGNLETASIRAFLGRGVLTSDGDAWLAYKRMNAPAFARGAVEGMQALVDDSIERSLATWATRGGERPLFDDFLRLAVTATTAGFLSVRPAEDEQDALAAAMLSGPELLFAMARNRAPWLRHLPLPAPRRVRRAIVAVEALLRRNVERRRAAGPADRADLLDLVLQYRHPRTGAPLPDAEVRDQLMTAVIAAPENIATTLSWAAYELAMNADVLARLRASLARGEREWLRAVVDETMRRHAATPMIDRTAAGTSRSAASACRGAASSSYRSSPCTTTRAGGARRRPSAPSASSPASRRAPSSPSATAPASASASGWPARWSSRRCAASSPASRGRGRTRSRRA